MTKRRTLKGKKDCIRKTYGKDHGGYELDGGVKGEVGNLRKDRYKERIKKVR